MKNTQENREKLAAIVVDSWDMDTLLMFAIGRLVFDYSADEELFQTDAADFKEELEAVPAKTLADETGDPFDTDALPTEE